MNLFLTIRCLMLPPPLSALVYFPLSFFSLSIHLCLNLAYCCPHLPFLLHRGKKSTGSAESSCFHPIFFLLLLILLSRHCNQDTTHPFCLDLQPPLLLFWVRSSSRQNRQRGGELDKPAENRPSKGSLYVSKGRCSHQRIHTQTQRHLALAYLHPLSPFLPVFAARSESKHTYARMAADSCSESLSVMFCCWCHALGFFFPVVGTFLWAHATGNRARLTGRAT